MKVFLVTFVNTGLILLVSNLDLNVADIPVVEWIFNGSYKDIGPLWFLNVGSNIILQCIVNIFSTTLMLCFGQIVKTCIRCCDRSCTNNMDNTCKKLN